MVLEIEAARGLCFVEGLVLTLLTNKKRQITIK